MTEDERDRAAIAALNDVKNGDALLPDRVMGRAIDIVTSISERTGLPFDRVLTDYDPDPRIPSGEFESLDAALLDLNETERYIAVRMAHRYAVTCRKMIQKDPSVLRQLWAVIHDNAIAEARG